jgi:hypothetical protein
MSLAGFKPAIPVIERPQNYASDRRATGVVCVVQFAGNIVYIVAVEGRHTGNVHTDSCQDVSWYCTVGVAAAEQSSIQDLEMYVAIP